MNTKYFIKNFIDKYGEKISVHRKQNNIKFKAIISTLNKKIESTIDFTKIGIVSNEKFYLCYMPSEEIKLSEGDKIKYNNTFFIVSYQNVVYFENTVLYGFATLYKQSSKEDSYE